MALFLPLVYFINIWLYKWIMIAIYERKQSKSILTLKPQ
jgi:hypothetical protein